MNVNMRDPDDNNNTLLHYATLYNNNAMVRYLAEKGAVQYKNDQGQTPLELATNACKQDSSFFDVKNSLMKI